MTTSRGDAHDRATDAATIVDADEPLDPAAMFALVGNQQRSMQSQMGDFVPVITGAWGITWLLGFGALWLIDGLRPVFALPGAAATAIFAAALVVTGLLSAWLGIRSGRGFRLSAAAAFTGTVYGVTWWIGSAGIAIFGAALRHNGMSAELAAFYYPSAFVLFAGIMYMVAAAIWQAVPSLVAGIALAVIAVAAPFFPYPTHLLVFALAGGGSFLILTVVMAVRLRRVRAAARVRVPNG